MNKSQDNMALCPAHKEIIKRIALGKVEAFLGIDGRCGLVGANRHLVEELRRIKLVSTIKRSKNSYLYVLTDAGRWKLAECFDELEPDQEPTGRQIETRFCKHCGNAFPARHHNQKYCGQCGRPIAISHYYSRQKMMADDEKHEKKIECHKKWREWAKENDPMYRINKAEAQRRWRSKQR